MLELLPDNTGACLSYYKSKGDKSSKGDVNLLRSEEGSTIKRVEIEGAGKDEQFVFEIYSPASLVHKSKPPVMLFAADSEPELQEWLAQVKYYAGRVREVDMRSSMSTGSLSVGRISSAAISSTAIPDKSSVPGVSLINEKFRNTVLSETDKFGNTSLHLMALEPSDEIRCAAYRSLCDNLGLRAGSGTYIAEPGLALTLENMKSCLWLLANGGHITEFVLKSLNDQTQSALHMAGISGRVDWGETIVAAAQREMELARADPEDLSAFTAFLALKDANGCSAEDYFRGHRLPLSLDVFSRWRLTSGHAEVPSERLRWLHAAGAGARAAGGPLRPHSVIGNLSGFTYFAVHFSTINIGAVLSQEIISRYLDRSFCKLNVFLL